MYFLKLAISRPDLLETSLITPLRESSVRQLGCCFHLNIASLRDAGFFVMRFLPILRPWRDARPDIPSEHCPVRRDKLLVKNGLSHNSRPVGRDAIWVEVIGKPPHGAS